MRWSRPIRPLAPRPQSSSSRPARKLVRINDSASANILARPLAGGRHSIVRRIGVVLVAFLVVSLLGLAGFRLAAYVREADVAQAIAPRTGRFVETGHGRMFLQDQGPRDRIPIVLIHGTAAWSEFWRGTIDHLLQQGHRVVALDLPPFGFSDRSPTGAYTRRDQARRIIGALDALGVERAVLVGHSFGAGATVEAVMLYPTRVAGLVLVAAALGLPPEGTEVAPASRVVDAFLNLPVLLELVVSATLTNPLLTRQLLATMIARKEAATPELADILRRPMTRQGTTRDFVAWVRGFVSPDLAAVSMSSSRYREIAVPTRLIWGDQDTLTPLAQGQRLAGLIPDARLRTLASLGHIPQIEDVTAFRLALDAALADTFPR